MRIMAIWTTQESDAIKIIRTKSDLKNAKFNGRKPDKLLIPPQDFKTLGISKLKNLVAHNGLILVLGQTTPIYNGKNKRI